ncbi:pentatricopeptide repeat-containing protein At2g02980, chloroplastic [Dioscorea cayenensis subsp. rotundata]|uniref:Pentatricopeptide repeat-containing protein At2g02980, chloroplastic n=1 Tax=Dioscorea cayennensis subsp. rotundata TaxID=55577 RepID=A0AB40D1W0_DIOCR|nr:pentatricopeptide repeat-containing protein At2g02980, chloroplastic [Dioscorea cayenensis subsp. rotundata]XP_039145082.1 pentatricopeptide repeat-containing protein At2g02980, chloroplastic [Dioscorea cayenensis subsp. rotundata]
MNPVSTVNPLFPAKPTDSYLPLHLLPKCNSIREFQQIHAITIKSDLDVSLLTKLITAISIRPTPLSLSYAHQLFDQIPHPGVLLFNTMSRAYSRSNTPLLSFSFFSRMLESGLFPDDYTFPSLLKACSTSKALKQGRQSHAVALKLGHAENAYVLPTLINMYAECGDINASRNLFDRMDQKCIVSYNSMITACVRSSRPSEALALFRELQADGIESTYVTMLSVLSSCALLGALELGRWIHEYVKKNGFSSYVKVNTALIDMYAKCGSLDDAVQVFTDMDYRDTQAWSAMIVAYAIHGHGTHSISLFEDMRREGIKPDDITFLGVLYACSHAGLVEQGLEYFHCMKRNHGITPGIKHYGCIVDLLARAGRLEEAYKFIDNSPITPTPILWRTLLSACGAHGNVDLGKKVFYRILELDDTHGGDYVILSNMCATKGHWEDVNKIRKLMKDTGAVKVPGCSSIEIENTVHEFFSGDGKHRNSEEVHRMVDEVVEQLKLVGYVPDTSKVFHAGLEEDEKEVSLRYHSEKLAIAFGLINTTPGTTIRVVKNLRVCGDCHSMAKFISMVFDRVIVLRDLNRFHHFKNGVCSCGDYW